MSTVSLGPRGPRPDHFGKPPEASRALAFVANPARSLHRGCGRRARRIRGFRLARRPDSANPRAGPSTRIRNSSIGIPASRSSKRRSAEAITGTRERAHSARRILRLRVSALCAGLRHAEGSAASVPESNSASPTITFPSPTIAIPRSARRATSTPAARRWPGTARRNKAAFPRTRTCCSPTRATSTTNRSRGYAKQVGLDSMRSRSASLLDGGRGAGRRRHQRGSEGGRAFDADLFHQQP